MFALRLTVILVVVALCSGCNQGDGEPNSGDSEPPPAATPVDTTGNRSTGLDAVPEAALAAARMARPDLDISEAEHEVRDGRQYYDVGGTLPDGSELELDMMLDESGWRVVEIQRDIAMDGVPIAVAEALAGHAPGWPPERIIESDQGVGVVIYAFFGPGEGEEPLKVEVKLEHDRAEVLTEEWMH